MNELTLSLLSNNADVLFNFEKAKKFIKCALRNKVDCKKDQVFVSAKGYGYSDLIICPYILLKYESEEKSPFWVGKNALGLWNVDVKKVVEIGLKNETMYFEGILSTMAKLVGMETKDFLAGMFGKEIPKCFDLDEDIFVVSNEEMMNGAIVAIAFRKELMNKFPNGYVVLPSSVNDVIVMDINKYNAELLDVVRCVNETKLQPGEFLAENVYTIKPRAKSRK